MKKEKLINLSKENFPKEKKMEVFYTNTKKVSCDGGSKSGHPLVYLEIGKNDFVICQYCRRKFTLKHV